VLLFHKLGDGVERSGGIAAGILEGIRQPVRKSEVLELFDIVLDFGIIEMA
jgi:hypothetical protein